jgi:hypothetical protein
MSGLFRLQVANSAYFPRGLASFKCEIVEVSSESELDRGCESTKQHLHRNMKQCDMLFSCVFLDVLLDVLSVTSATMWNCNLSHGDRDESDGNE